ncbi:unnamed protein product [Peronospora farinosa]|uniref:Uncharacterized protein n=1 Tax=Peronospora farinosa TaxID=134698 RepID=A0AAV0SS48_9STRA|nr:unnamed protein product [Peronospora farinosa]
MFVFEAIDAGALVLVEVTTKTQLPFDEYIVVAGQVQCSRQLTCFGGRVKRDGKRRLLVVPLPQAQDTETLSVQVLDVGEVAVNFLQGLKACFPTLVRKNVMADDSSDSEEEEKAHKKQKHETEILNDVNAQQLKTRALEYMGQIKVKMLATLDEFINAFQIADPSSVLASLQNDASMPKHYQLMSPPEPFNVGVVFLEAATSKGHKQFLHIPVPRSPPLPDSGDEGKDYVQESFQDATVLTFGAKREETAHGGGKTSEEMIKNIRMRHASGTFCTLVLPTKTWKQVVNEHRAFLPQVCELQGELRLRRLMGNAPCGVPVELLLE